MNRCPDLPIERFLRMLVLVLAWTSIVGSNFAAAQTQPRQFPADAKRGMLQVTMPPEVLINGTPARLSPFDQLPKFSGQSPQQ